MCALSLLFTPILDHSRFCCNYIRQFECATFRCCFFLLLLHSYLYLYIYAYNVRDFCIISTYWLRSELLNHSNWIDRKTWIKTAGMYTQNQARKTQQNHIKTTTKNGKTKCCSACCVFRERRMKKISFSIYENEKSFIWRGSTNLACNSTCCVFYLYDLTFSSDCCYLCFTTTVWRLYAEAFLQCSRSCYAFDLAWYWLMMVIHSVPVLLPRPLHSRTPYFCLHSRTTNRRAAVFIYNTSTLNNFCLMLSLQ